MIEVKIKAKHLDDYYFYKGVTIQLPASRSMMIDALDQAQVPPGSGEYILYPTNRTPDLISGILYDEDTDPSLSEMNQLAERMQVMHKSSSLDEETALAQLFAIAEHREIETIPGLINATHNLFRYALYPGSWELEDIGDLVLSGDPEEYFPELAHLPDALLDCFDLEKFGRLVQQKERGIFTGYGYLIQGSDEWDVVYNESASPDRAVTMPEGTPVISLRISAAEEMKDRYAQLDCPFTSEELEQAMREAGIASPDEIYIQSVSSPITRFEFTLHHHHVEEINELAKTLTTVASADYTKLKAMLELNDPADFESLLELTGQVNEYTLRPHPAPPTIDPRIEKIGLNPDLFRQLGMAQDMLWLSDHGYQETPYGYLAHGLEQEPQQDISCDPAMGGM